jgi:hypothetical protein
LWLAKAGHLPSLPAVRVAVHLTRGANEAVDEAALFISAEVPKSIRLEVILAVLSAGEV